MRKPLTSGETLGAELFIRRGVNLNEGPLRDSGSAAVCGLLQCVLGKIF